jgi:hypothetical protein
MGIKIAQFYSEFSSFLGYNYFSKHIFKPHQQFEIGLKFCLFWYPY